MNIQQIPLDQIRESKEALRGVDVESDGFKSVYNSLAGDRIQLQNVTVMPKKDEADGSDYYLLVNGLQRFTAFKMLRDQNPGDAFFETIGADILNTMDDVERLKYQVIANTNQVATKPSDVAKAIRTYMIAAPEATLTEIANLYHQSTAWVNRHLNLNKLSGDIMALVDAGSINASNANALATLPEEDRAAFLEDAQTVQSNQFAARVVNRLNEIKKAKKEGREAAPEGFIPIPKRRPESDVKVELDSRKYANTVIATSNMNAVDAFIAGIQWTRMMDPETIADKKAKWEAEQAAKAEKAEAKKIERAKKLGITPEMLNKA